MRILKRSKPADVQASYLSLCNKEPDSLNILIFDNPLLNNMANLCRLSQTAWIMRHVNSIPAEDSEKNIGLLLSQFNNWSIYSQN